MIDLDNIQSRKGALSALQAIIKSKNKQFSVDETDIDNNQKKKTPLILPKNVKVLKNKKAQQNQDETAEQRQIRVDQIKADLENPDTLTQIEQDNKNAQANKKIKAQKLAQAVQNNGLISGSELKNDLVRMLKSQIKLNKHSSETYARVNPSYAGTKLLVAGKKIEYGKNIPSLVVYLDQSGSWSNRDVLRAQTFLSGLRTLEKQKLIKVNLLYFSNTVESDAETARNQGGTRAFPKILDDIRVRKPTNVMILSDSDFDGVTYWPDCHAETVKGFVIWGWKRGDRSRRVQKYLQGKLGNSEYII